MYLNYYCLKFKPFEISPDPSFLWLGEKHKEALTSLESGIRKDSNFMLLMGDPGTGKTTIVNALSKRLENDFVIARIFDPSLSEADFFNLTANELGIKKKFKSKDSFLLNFSDFLSTVHKKNKKLIIIIVALLYK